MTGQGQPNQGQTFTVTQRVEVAWSDPMPELRDEERPRQVAVGTEARCRHGGRLCKGEGSCADAEAVRSRN